MKLFRNRLLAIFAGLAAVGVFAVASWATLDYAFHATGDYEFCTSCHGYEPIAAAYKEDVHGGNNAVGFRAACNDCHLPHGNPLHYFAVKARHGIVDPTMALIKKPHEIDWHGIRERREEFVYVSGCLECHKNLQEATADNKRAARAHKRFFDAPDDYHCVECHDVGHQRLGEHLEAMGWPAPAKDDPLPGPE